MKGKMDNSMDSCGVAAGRVDWLQGSKVECL